MSFDLDAVLLISFLIFGLLCLYTAFRLWKDKTLFDSFVLYPGNCKRQNCLDPEGFIAFMRPRLAVVGGVCVVIALYYTLKYYFVVPTFLTIVHYVLTAAFLIWATLLYHRAAKKFW